MKHIRMLVLVTFIALNLVTLGRLSAQTSPTFFTDLASRLLKSELNLDLHRLQISPTNQYTPSVHRLLQVTANVHAAINPTNDVYGPLPTVFRPRFQTEGNLVFIEDYEEVMSFNPSEISPQPLDLSFSNAVFAVKSNSLIFGVPFVIGARKGLPNFNEFASESAVQITRRLELRKSAPGGGNLIIQTNQMFVIGISNAFGAEFWNSYAGNYQRPVEVAAFNFCLLALTNDFGFVHRANLTGAGQILLPANTTNFWSGWNSHLTIDGSFLVPLRSNHIVIPNSAYSQNNQSFKPLSDTFEVTPTTPVALPFPRWGLTITNRVVAFVRDSATGRLLDYVQLNNMVGHRDLTEEMAQPATALDFDGLWSTNSQNGYLSGRPGVINQILISKGDDSPLGGGDWRSFGIDQPTGRTKSQEIAKFRAFFTPDNQASYQDDLTGEVFAAVNTNLVATAPFTPTWKQSVALIWQVNDPLVHYMTGDMEDLQRSRVVQPWSPPAMTKTILSNLGRVNERYLPWGGNPFATSADTTAYSHVLKDPLIRSSEDWDFPNDEPLSPSILGRIHRGTPWQTVYLKSTSVTDAVNAGAIESSDWQIWVGNRDVRDAERTWPTRDWRIAALIASLVNTNDPRTLLFVNERDTNAWRAVLDGIVAFTNSSTDLMLTDGIPPQFDPVTIISNSTQAAILAEAVWVARAAQSNQYFRNVEDFLAVPELSNNSPWLSTISSVQRERGISDEAYERIPALLLSRLRLDSIGFTIPTATEIIFAKRLSNGAFLFAFTNSISAVIGVLAATNAASPLNEWTVLIPPTEIAPGLYQFTDSAAANFPHRYYQIRSP